MGGAGGGGDAMGRLRDIDWDMHDMHGWQAASRLPPNDYGTLKYDIGANILLGTFTLDVNSV